MRLILILLLFISTTCYAQIELEEVKKKEVEAISYDGSFMTFDIGQDERVKAGVVGELVTLFDVSAFNIYDSKESLENRRSIDYGLSKEFENKTFRVENYWYDLYDFLEISNDKATYFWKVSSTDKYVFNKYLEKIKETLLNKEFWPIYLENEFESVDGIEVNLSGESTLNVTAVSLSKLGLDYVIILTLDDSIKTIYPNDIFGQPKVFNGEVYSLKDGYVNIQSNNYSKNKVTLIEATEWEIFVQDNSNFIDAIRNKKVKIGMTEEQCRWAWGMPNSTMSNIGGYEKVLIYGDVAESQNLYFKGNILKLIK